LAGRVRLNSSWSSLPTASLALPSITLSLDSPLIQQVTPLGWGWQASGVTSTRTTIVRLTALGRCVTLTR